MDLFINFKDESNLEYFNKNLYKIDNEKNYVVNFNFLFLEEINNDNVGYDINNNYKIYNIDTSSKKLLYKECIYFNANFNKISNLVKTTGDVKFCKHIWSDITIKSDHYKNQEVYVLRFNTNNNLNESITLDNNIESLNNYLFSVIEDVDAFVCMINKLEYEIEEILKYKPKLINKLAFNSNYNSPALKKHIVNNNSYYTPSFIDKKINNIDDSAKTVRYTKRKNINPVYMVLNLINNGGNINYILNDLIRELQSCIPKTSYVISFYFYYVTNYIYVKANSYNILDKNINKIDLLSNIINKNRTNLKNLLQYSTYIDNNNFSNMDSNINLLCAKNTNNIDYNKIALKYTINFENIKYNNSVSSIYINDKIEKNLNFNDKYKKYQNPKISLNKTNDLDYDLIDSETDSNFLSKYYTLNKNFTTKSSNNSASKILITKTKNSPIKNTKTKYLLIKNKSNKKNSSFKPKINIFYKKNKPLYTEINKLINIQTLYDIDVKLKYNYKTINIKVLFEEYLQILKILSAKKNIFLSLNVSFDENVIVEKTKVDVVFLTIINFIINNNNICLLEKDSSYNYSKNSAKSLNNLNYTSFNKECRKTLFIKIYKEYIKNSSNVNKIKSNSKNIINEYQINVSIKFNDDDAILAYKNINELLFFYYSSFYFSSLDTSYINDLKYKNLDVNLEKNNYYLSIVEKLNYLHKDLLVAINIIKTWDKSFDIILCHNQCNGKSNNNLQKYKNLVEIKFGIPFLQIYNNNFKMNSFYKLPSIKQSEEHLNNIIINIFKNEFFKTSIIAKEDTCLKNKIEIYDVNADYYKDEEDNLHPNDDEINIYNKIKPILSNFNNMFSSVKDNKNNTELSVKKEDFSILLDRIINKSKKLKFYNYNSIKNLSNCKYSLTKKNDNKLIKKDKIFEKWDVNDLKIKYFTPPRYLIVEDTFTERLGLRKIINSYNSRIFIDIADDGPQAVSKFNKMICQGYIYDLIIMDIEIPYINGIEVAQYIRSDEKIFNAHTIIIAATSKKKDNIPSNIFDKIFEKPFTKLLPEFLNNSFKKNRPNLKLYLE